MPDIELKRLRKLRHRAQTLASTLASDLKSFRHEQIGNGFRRKPTSESDPNDVNITTTCSCLMGLALSSQLPEFYGEKWKDIAAEVFTNVMEKPWMSSGLSENNAFTTTLVIRLYGFLRQSEVLDSKPAETYTRPWEAFIDIKDLDGLISKLTNQAAAFSKFLFDLLPLSIQSSLKSYKTESPESIKDSLAGEFNRLINNSDFYDEGRFAGIELSTEALDLRAVPRNAYVTAHFNRVLLHDFFKNELEPLRKKSLREIATEMATEVGFFKINNYPPAAAVVYWFVDGVDRAGISLSAEQWTNLCKFSTNEFDRQRSRFDARYAAMMDPVAMAMAACLCARLRMISKDLLLGTKKQHQAILPSAVELESSVSDSFLEQTGSGIWPKYFPLFHYQEAGSNFCFTFELLEAILAEFGKKQNHLLTQELVISGLEKAVSYCELNRLHCSEEDSKDQSRVSYQGWNSGGELESLRQSLPESWATAVVHMFLFELIEVLSVHIQERILLTYSASNPKAKWNDVGKLLDIDLWLDRKNIGLKSVLSNSILATFANYRGSKSYNLRRNPTNKAPLSALLFGPPGTSKTEVAKAISKDLGWPLIEIDPSTFLQDGFQNLYVQAERIFEDVMDLSGVVVLFDEMDALVQKRDGSATIDTEARFLTTYMLPKLAKLHDKGQTVFLMATNFQATFDDAIKRAGRFDFLLCMGPPKIEDKCNLLHRFFDLDDEHQKETAGAGDTLLEYATANPWLWDQLSLYTYGEFKSFITGLGTPKDIGTKLIELKEEGFLKAAQEDSETVSLKLRDLDPLMNGCVPGTKLRLGALDQVPLDEASARQKGLDPKLPAVKYVIDRQQTRRQCTLPNQVKVATLAASAPPPST